MDCLGYCSDCPQGIFCCVNPKNEDSFVPIGIEDAERISKKTGKKFSEFLDYSKLSEKALESCEGDGWNSEIIKDGRVLRFKMAEDGKCVFLKNNQCSIYETRALLCRMYPFWYKKTDFGKIEIELFDKNEPCPLSKANINAIKLSKEDEEELIRIALEMEEETEFYKKNIDKFVKENNLMEE